MKNEENKMMEIIQPMMEHICDKLCVHPKQTKTEEELGKDIHRYTGMTFFRRGAEDVPCLLGVWV